ncbi:uncharacterized protein VTP21DRAFT_962 [Calcarisporiella thermophila]|uniref:uncharacterized protein n=1 Tax=Calcarisporiella thermophila TaxID=911321 RepID=UPI003741EBF2
MNIFFSFLLFLIFYRFYIFFYSVDVYFFPPPPLFLRNKRARCEYGITNQIFWKKEREREREKKKKKYTGEMVSTNKKKT